MADAPAHDLAVLLLRSLPAEVADLVLARMDEATVARLRTALRSAPATPPDDKELDAALAQFFDLQRIADRSVAAGAYTPVAAAPTPAPDASGADDLRTLPPEHLARALQNEQPGTIVLVLSCLDPAVAGQVMKRLPADSRAEIAVRMARPAPRNPALFREIVRAVTEKARRLGAIPPEPSPEELISNLANMLRAVPRAERLPVMRKIEDTDPELAAKVMEKLYRIEDLLRIQDRQIQALLGKLDVKTIALALSGTTPGVRDKVMANMSSRSKTVLAEEMELLKAVPAERIREAQGKVMTMVKKGEEAGEITMEE